MVPDVVAELVMGRVCYGPSLSWAEFVMSRDVPESPEPVSLITPGHPKTPQDTPGRSTIPKIHNKIP